MSRTLALASFLLMAAACSQQGSGSSSSPAVTARPDGEPPVAAAALKTEATVVEGQNMLTVKPGHVFACEGRDRVVSTIGWSSADPAVKGVTIKVQGPSDSERKLFTAGGVEGAAETGNWMIAGVKVFMVDSASGKDLATHEVTSYPCQ